MRIPSLSIISALIAGFLPSAHDMASVIAKEKARFEANLWALRESRSTRYAKRPVRSQQQRRRACRRQHPHGF